MSWIKVETWVGEADVVYTVLFHLQSWHVNLAWKDSTELAESRDYPNKISRRTLLFLSMVTVDLYSLSLKRQVMQMFSLVQYP